MSKRPFETSIARLRRAIAREASSVAPGESAVQALARRARREAVLLARDVRGLPMRAVHAARLRAEIEAAVPWAAEQHERVLREGHLRSAAEPRVSVIVPVYGKVAMTLRCLVSLGTCREATPFEVIVVDDCSPDETERVLSAMPGIRYARAHANGGFVASCNLGASLARGRTLCFLNNDTIVLPGWLDRLIETLDAEPDAGLVGSRLIYPRLALQEAGGVVWRDGSATNFGNGRDPFSPTYNYLRDADYCSAASVAIEKELFDRVGGFDARYRPAYYEDTHLAFAVRAAGERVLYQPASRVVHDEGGTAGTDLDAGPKKHQLANRETFRAAWADVLEAHGPYGDLAPRELDRRSVASVLVIDHRTPTPDRDSGSVDAVHMLALLRRMGCRVTFVPIVPLPPAVRAPEIKPYAGEYTDALQRIGVETAYSPYDPSVAQLLRERGDEFDLVILSRARVADRCLAMVRRHCPRAKILFNTTDLAYLRESREAEHVGSRLRGYKAADTKKRELGAVAASDATLVISRYEADLLAREVPDAKVRILPLIRSIPGRSAPLAGRHGVLFVGGFRHRPNLDAALFLVRWIWPHVRDALPGARLHVVGSDTPPEIRALAADDVEIHGHVPDLAAMLARVRLTVAPLRYGAGLKGKVADSLGHGVPCVTTSVGVEGSALVDGRDVLVADEPPAIARAIVRLHTDDALWERLSDAGLAFVREQYSLESNARRLAALLDELGIAHR